MATSFKRVHPFVLAALTLSSSPLLTFQRAVIHPLLDLGLLHQVGGLQGEDELPETRPEAVPVVLHHGHAVLWGTDTREVSGGGLL